MKILNILTSLYHVEHDTCTVNGRNIKTRYSGSILILESKTFYQTRSNAILLQGTLPAYGFPKVERLKTGEMLYERRYLSPRPPPKISLKHDHNWTEGNDQLGSTVATASRETRSTVLEKHHVLSFPNQPNPNPNQSGIDRGNPRTQNVLLWTKEKRSVHTRSMKSVRIKNLFLQIDR